MSFSSTSLPPPSSHPSTSSPSPSPSSSSSIDDLKSTLLQTLSSRGVLDDIKSRIRSEILSTLMDTNSPSPSSLPPPLSPSSLLIHSLIHEFLLFHGYLSTLSVFEPEAKIREGDVLSREFVEKTLRIQSERERGTGKGEERVPLLYDMVAILQEGMVEKKVKK